MRRANARAARAVPSPIGVSVATYAEAHNVCLDTVYKQIKRGLIIAVRVDGRMMVQARH